MIDTVPEAELFWLNATNIILGLVVVVCCAIMAVAVVQALLERARSRRAAMREIEADMRSLGSHAFEVPGLGLTMADGGEPMRPKPAGQETAPAKKER